MKLPGIEYNTSVRSLGREDPGAPIAVANAEANALEGVARIVKTIEANDVAMIASKFQSEMSELNATAKNRKSYTTEELDSLDIKYGSQYGQDKLTSVPAYLVSGKIYKKLSSEILKKYSGLTTSKGRSVIAKMYGGLYKEGITTVVSSSIREAQSARSVAIESDFDAAVAAGSLDAASIVANTALATGMWNHEKFFAKTKDMPGKIASSKYLSGLNNVNDPNVLEVFKDSALIDTRLSPKSKNSIYKMYEAKIKSLNKENDKQAKEQRKQESYDSFVITATGLLDSGEPAEWGALQSVALNMEPADGKAIITLNKMMHNKGLNTDPKVHMALTTQIRSISLPREGTTINQRRADAVNKLMAAAGYDPFTGNQVGPSKISPEDFSKLWGDINKAQAFAYDNPEVKRMSDQIWTTLTGGSKDMMTRFFGTGADTINATRAESDMLQAARAGGPAFDPDAWWQQNGLKYVTAAIEDNEKTMTENRLDKYVVRDFNSPGGIDINKTTENIFSRVKSGQMDKDDANRAIRDIYELQQQRIKRMEMFNKNKGDK